MNQTSTASCTSSELLNFVDEKFKETKAGQSFIVIYNGKDTMSFFIASLLIATKEGISHSLAKKVENHLAEKRFSIRKFRISKTAFEAIFRKPVLKHR